MAQIRKMLRGVITNGTAKNADIPGWDVAGKTGTAQKWKNGKYSNDLFISNFIGFFPYENPQLLAFIMLDEPQQPFHWGSEGAAIAFKRVIKRIINMDDSILPPNRDRNPVEYVIRDDVIIQEQQPLVTEVSALPQALSTEARFSNKVEMPELRGCLLYTSPSPRDS